MKHSAFTFRRTKPTLDVIVRLPVGLWPALALVVTAAACNPAPSASPVATPSERPTGTAGQQAEFGPLAVAHLELGLEALEEGTIVVEQDCVYLAGRTQRWFLVWPEARVRWSAKEEAVAIANVKRPPYLARDGDAVVMSGGGDMVAEGGLPDVEWLASQNWVSAPHPSCDLKSRWFVNEVVPKVSQ